MAKDTKYSIRDLKRDFPDDDTCLEFLFDALHTRECSCGGTYSRYNAQSGGKRKGLRRKQFRCSKCRYEIAPMAGTIFEGSTTPLTVWFHVLFVFSNAKSSVSAKEIERQTGVTYKTAWRMLKLIREQLAQSDGKLSGTVEMDEAYFGGHGNAGPNNVNLSSVMKSKTTVMAAVARESGEIRAKVVPDATAGSVGAFLRENIEATNTRLLTDGSNRYGRAAKLYDRHVVNHGRGEYVRGDVHTNNTEAFWSHVKRSIRGTHKVVSRKHFQSYLDAFVFLRNNRHNDSHRFGALLASVAS